MSPQHQDDNQDIKRKRRDQDDEVQRIIDTIISDGTGYDITPAPSDPGFSPSDPGAFDGGDSGGGGATSDF